MLVSQIQSKMSMYLFLCCLRGLWGRNSLHGNVTLSMVTTDQTTPGQIVDVLERSRRAIVEQQHPRTAADMGLIQYAGDMAGFRMWSEEPTDHIRVACDLHTVTINIGAGTEEQLREILAQSGSFYWAYMATSGAVTEGSLDELVAIEMAAQVNETFIHD